MKAAIIKRYGSADAFRIQDMPRPTPADSSMLIIIDGKPATHQELEEMSKNNLFTIDFLSPAKARAIYGLAGAHGALLVSTTGKKQEDPLVILNGREIPADSLNNVPFEQIHVLRGQQAINLYGPAAKEGAYLVKTAPEPVNVWVEVVDVKGRPVKGVQLINEENAVLAITNNCGIALLENFPKGNHVKLHSKKHKPQQAQLANQKEKFILKK